MPVLMGPAFAMESLVSTHCIDVHMKHPFGANSSRAVFFVARVIHTTSTSDIE